jgi:hypothetical protein
VSIYRIQFDFEVASKGVDVDTWLISAGPWVSVIRLPREMDVTKNFKGKTGFVSGWGKSGDGK